MNPTRGTETFAQVTLSVSNLRWAGVPFMLRTGRALAHRCCEVLVHFLTGNLANPQIRVSLRWKSLRHELAHTGAPKAALAAVDPLIDGPHTAGDTLVAIANLDGIQLLAHLPDAPPDVARCGMLPDVAPLLAWRQRQLPYVVVVVTDRLGAELLAVVPTGPDREVRVEGEGLHITRSAPGGWSQRHFQQRAENRWQQNAGAVAEALTRLVDQVHPRLGVVTGAVRAVQFLRVQVPDLVSELLQVVDGEYDSLDGALAKAAPLMDLLEARDTTQVLAGFARELGQGDRAADGARGDPESPGSRAVETLLLQPGRVAGSAWFGPLLARTSRLTPGRCTPWASTGRWAPLVDVALRGRSHRRHRTSAGRSAPQWVRANRRDRSAATVRRTASDR